ncbi:VPS10 domain-containing protein [Aequorivita sp. CIP111184]|uniref:WD40/YVTN/BNR-like repeat-containing protein n=1 Tax=Aequorivita sp. CIP111184 TaxID=2211356 RepID=UPI000DBBFDFF|nr:YCF48-related protein [Aequorivita sp. CIP111184]SRX56064.1 Ycf48-like protein [Aequorivita sp. CIP111184]
MRFLIALFAVTLLFSCEKKTEVEFNSVEITPVFIDSLSIRAIQPLDESRVWFAADKGKVGLIDGDTPKLAVIKYGDSLLHFRSIAVNKDAVFVLSISNPAVLYKIGFNGTDATNIEEVYTEKGDNVFYDSMKFWNENEGIAIGDPIENCMSIIITRDGGNTWEKLSCDNLPKVEKGEAAFAASNSNIAIFGDNAWVATGGRKSRVLHTKDKGKTWEIFNTPIVQGKAMTGIFSIDFRDENNGIIFGGNWEDKPYNEGNKAITKDAGKTWKLIANGKEPGYRSSVKYIPGTEGQGIVAVGSPGISFSGDGGKNWKELSKEGFFAIEFVSDSVAFASGNNRISKLVFKK